MTFFQKRPLVTGCEAYYAVDAPAQQVKAITTATEEGSVLGRLFDMGVLDASGKKLERAGCGALLAMLTATVDTNLIARSDRETAKTVSREVAMILRKNRYPDEQTLASLDEAFTAKNLSPGGTADLLSATCFLHFLKS